MVVIQTRGYQDIRKIIRVNEDRYIMKICINVWLRFQSNFLDTKENKYKYNLYTMLLKCLGWAKSPHTYLSITSWFQLLASYLETPWAPPASPWWWWEAWLWRQTGREEMCAPRLSRWNWNPQTPHLQGQVSWDVCHSSFSSSTSFPPCFFLFWVFFSSRALIYTFIKQV